MGEEPELELAEKLNVKEKIRDEETVIETGIKTIV